ncbi:MAG TPA: hypothetical protein VMG08_04585 [Allosphingosinicella sp.]|nr:hypothetical protein [Allosphingosinicella sp.]
MDDELSNMVWMMDYLDSENYLILPFSDANSAIEAIESEVYRCIVLDLNIPILPPLDEAAAQLGSIYATYPGLYVARRARNRGYRDRQVVIYSVHREQAVTEEVERLRCTYIRKGRPKEIKEELAAVLAFDPTAT